VPARRSLAAGWSLVGARRAARRRGARRGTSPLVASTQPAPIPGHAPAARGRLLDRTIHSTRAGALA
jgi:hypothetical protein